MPKLSYSALLNGYCLFAKLIIESNITRQTLFIENKKAEFLILNCVLNPQRFKKIKLFIKEML